MFDTIVLAVLAVWILLGLWKGLVKQVVGLAGLVAAYVAAVKFSGPLAGKFLTGFGATAGHVISFFAVFIACIVAASIVGSVIGRLVSRAGLGVLNRVGGGALGGLKACFALAVATMLLIAYLPPGSRVLKDSRTVRYIRPMADLVSRSAPDRIRTKYEENAARPGGAPGRRR